MSEFPHQDRSPRNRVSFLGIGKNGKILLRRGAEKADGVVRAVPLLLCRWESHRPRAAPHFHGLLPASRSLIMRTCVYAAPTRSRDGEERKRNRARVYVERATGAERRFIRVGFAGGSLTLRFYFLTSPPSAPRAPFLNRLVVRRRVLVHLLLRGRSRFSAFGVLDTDFASSGPQEKWRGSL